MKIQCKVTTAPGNSILMVVAKIIASKQTDSYLACIILRAMMATVFMD